MRPGGSQRVCGECGRPLGEGAAFCRACGARYQAPAGEETPPGSSEALPPVEPVPPAERTAKPARPGVAPQPPAKPAAPSPPPVEPSPAGEPLPPVAGRSRRLAPLAIGAAVLVAVGAVAGAILVERSGSSGGGGSAPAEPATSRGGEAPGEAASGFPPVGRSRMTREIRDLLLAFHEDVVAGNFQAAWALLSPRKHRQDLAEPGGYQAWKSAQASLYPYLSPAGLRVRIASLEGEGVARVMLTGMGWSQPGSPCSEWSGLTWVKYQNGDWTYDPGYSTTPSRQRAWKPRTGELLGVGC